MVADQHPAERPRPAEDVEPPRVHMGLLDYIAVTAVDQDYALVSDRRHHDPDHPDQRDHADQPGQPGQRARPARPGRTGLAVLAVFGVLVATAAVQTSRDADQSAVSRETLVKQADARKDDLGRRRALVRDLQRQIRTLEAGSLDATAKGRAVQARLDRLALLSGSQATRGPGIQVRVDDAPGADSSKQQVQAPDLQKLVNSLWQVGAEAVSINGERLTSLTPIRDAAGAVTVNFRSLSRPYVVSAVGDPRQMGAELLDTAGGRAWVTLQSTFGLQFDVDNKDSMVLPGARRLALRHAHQPRVRR